MYDHLTAAGIEFIPEYPVGRYHIDIFIPSSKLAIECDGDFWHRGRQAKDARKTAKLQEAGFTVIRFTGKEIHNAPDECVTKILAEIAKSH